MQLTGAFSINDLGEIVCQGVTTSGELHACIAVPNNEVKEPSSAGPLGASVPLTDTARELLRRRLGMPPR